MDKLVRNKAVQTASAPKPQTGSKDFQSTFPSGITPDTLFDPRTEMIVGCFADRLVATGAFRQYERQDIAQNFRLLLLSKMPAFKPEAQRPYGYAAWSLPMVSKMSSKAATAYCNAPAAFFLSRTSWMRLETPLKTM